MIFLLGLSIVLSGVADAQREADLIAKFKQPKLWTDRALEKTLAGYLDEAKKSYSDGLIDALIERIDHDIYSYPGVRTKVIAVEKQFPVVGVLSEIGPPCVPALIDVLKKVDPSDKKGDPGGRRMLCIVCLVKVYERGGFGVELAKERIRLEIGKSQGKEKLLLENALKHSFLEKAVAPGVQ